MSGIFKLFCAIAALGYAYAMVHRPARHARATPRSEPLCLSGERRESAL